ncbi:ATP-binding cassette domain-containing protein [Lactobacillus delbrueckii subsp. bulgaricus]
MEDARIKRQACLSVAEFTQEIVDNIGIVGVPFLAGILYFRGQVAFGAIIAAGYLANGVFSSLQESFSAYISAKSTTKLNETMLQHLQVQAAAKTEDPQTIVGRGIEVNLGGQVIKYPDFTIKAGEKVLLTGPSGCGKSSLFKLLLGQIEPSKGQLTYLDSEGKEIQNPARSFEYLPQAGWIFPGTVADNITMYDAKKQTKLAEVLKKVGLDRDFSKAVDLDREVSPQQAGLDANLKDGFARVENEAEILRQLADLTGVVNYLDDFTSWRHHFLVEEYIAGQSLEELLATEFPFVVGDLEKKARYKAKAIKILEQLKELLKQIHARGLAVGDLSLSNILVTEDGDVRLIDLENAGKATEKYVPGLTTVGFVSRAAKTYAEADDFALARIAYYLFLPVIPVADLAPDIIAKQEKWIGGYFGQDLVQFLRKIAGNMQASEPIFLKKPLAIPEKDLSRQTVDFFTDGLTRGILRHSRFDQVGLVPNLHEKNADPMELLNLARGAAGILWAVGQNADLQAWVARNQGKIIKIAEESEATGLFNGLAGLASVLEKRDFPALAKQLRQILRQKVDLNMADNSLATGLTGIALALREEKPEVSEKIAEELAGRWKQVDFANFADEDVGLLTGWGGVSWLFWQLGQKEVAEEIVSRILRDHAEEAETLTISDQSRGFERLLPYLENGNFGLALLMHKFMGEDPAFKQRYQLPFDKLKKSCLTYCTYMETLVSGYSGVLPLAKSLAGDGDYALLDYALAALNQYLVANNDEILVPGKYGYKLSLDFSTGSAGLLTLLKDLRQRDEFSWLPL